MLITLDERLTTRPPPAAFIGANTSRQRRKTESTLTSITRRHSARSISQNGRRAIPAKSPALLIRMSTRPFRSTTCRTAALTPSSSVTSRS
ncbi:MAG: hypothetical protein OXI06_10345 [bacterium]|nr:hypothetical protein [bacterium]